MITEEEKLTTPFDEIFAFDRTVSRLLEMQSQDYLKVQYSEWLQRRRSSKDLLTSLLKTESKSQDSSLESSSKTKLDSISVVDPVLESGDEIFVPVFHVNQLNSDLLQRNVKESSTSSLSTSSTSFQRTIEKILKRTIEQMTGKFFNLC